MHSRYRSGSYQLKGFCLNFGLLVFRKGVILLAKKPVYKGTCSYDHMIKVNVDGEHGVGLIIRRGLIALVEILALRSLMEGSSLLLLNQLKHLQI